eukprot:Skav216902  [mRNA]  locus=scaffold685:137994:143684:- [translate_table: standard]
MLSAADVKLGEVLLDPMCGTGMLLTEAPGGCQVLGISAKRPLPDGSVDVIVCDLPFGRQFGTVDPRLPAVVLLLTRSGVTRGLEAFGPKAGRFAVQRKQQNPELQLCRKGPAMRTGSGGWHHGGAKLVGLVGWWRW